MTDQQGIAGDTLPTTTEPAGTAQEVLLRVTRWQVMTDKRLGSQMTLLEAIEHFALIELRIHYPDGVIDPGFVISLVDAVLQKLIDGKPLIFVAVRDAPYRWPGGADPGLPADRRETVIRTVDTVAAYCLEQYKQYLHDHWQTKELEPRFDRMIERKLQRYIDDIEKLFHPEQLAGLTAARLRDRIEKIQERGARRYRLTSLASPRERKIIEALAFEQLPHWLRVLKEPDRRLLHDHQEQTMQAQAVLDNLLEGYGSLQAYARQRAIDFIQLQLDMQVEPDTTLVRLAWRSAVGERTQNRSLTELLAGGPIGRDFASVAGLASDTPLRNQPLESPFIADMLATQDLPTDYHHELVRQYEREDVKEALSAWFSQRLKQSAFVARCAGHLSVADHERLEQVWDGEASVTRLRVCGLTLPNGMKCADLLLFYREEAAGGVNDLLLYAPNKPDGQEWVRLPSLMELSGELWGWTQTESGREYLLRQLSPATGDKARAYLFSVSNDPRLWGMSRDIRRGTKTFVDCADDAAQMGLANNLKQVEQDHSPGWYAALGLEARRRISSLNQELEVHQQVLSELLTGYEVFVDFAKRTIAEAITPYLRSRNVLEPVDPATVLIDHSEPGNDYKSKVSSLLDLAIYGYDENRGINHPDRGVRSSVGQDLSQLRSAELALYLRRAYLGDAYAKEIRGKYLESGDPAYDSRRYAYRNVLLSKMDRDLRVARSKDQILETAYIALVRQVSRLSNGELPSGRGSGASIVAHDGVFRFAIRGHIVLGVYVFVWFDPDAASWLYMPDAPDGVTFRRYESFCGETTGALNDYVMSRVATGARQAVSRYLRALTAKNMHVDTLYEWQRVGDCRGEFNACIERAVTDVADITTSRAEVIEKQVVKGLVFAAAPFCIVFPPFALLLDAAFIAASVTQALGAHQEGDTDAALLHWLEASWGALFAMVGAGSAIKLLGQALRSLKQTVRPISLLAERLKSGAPARTKETLPMVREVRFKPKQAVAKAPERLQRVTDDSVFFGTWRSAPSTTQAQPAYYIRHKGKYYQVKKNPHFDGLSLIDAQRPNAIYNRPIRLTPRGKWTHERVGLRGGNDTVRNLGSITDLREAFPGRVSPDPVRGALQGEAVVAKLVDGAADNYLFSVNAQTCVVASLYNPATKIGAVIHIDHNIRSLIKARVDDVVKRIGGEAKDVRATLVGGDWLFGGDIGGVIRSELRRNGVRPTWDYWSYSLCVGNTFGVSLNLRNGVTTVFKHSMDSVRELYNPLSRAAHTLPAHMPADNLSQRVLRVEARVASTPLYENRPGVVVDKNGKAVTSEMIHDQAFALVLL
ncbi:type III effector 1 [Pseudomonas hamedanensis]|uniref:Type III effector 1 n=1 Tax=Pseudomonas hamedanensis TaxID=2745504 RepID=A0A9E6TEX3_9PSED|nr:type III effector 1 [Pseudomonas hamedanensis]QXI15124.1 type III effector 1 [Pseudomonas hamedanensis]